MELLLQRLSYLISDILLYQNKVTSVSKPIFSDYIYITVRIGDVAKTLSLPYNIVSMNDSEFNTYCLKFCKEEGLL